MGGLFAGHEVGNPRLSVFDLQMNLLTTALAPTNVHSVSADVADFARIGWLLVCLRIGDESDGGLV
jgi:hypothetical protein